MTPDEILSDLRGEYQAILVGEAALVRHAPAAEALTVRVIQRSDGWLLACILTYSEKACGKNREYETPILQKGCASRSTKAPKAFLRAAQLVESYVHLFNPALQLHDRTRLPTVPDGDPRARLAALLK